MLNNKSKRYLSQINESYDFAIMLADEISINLVENIKKNNPINQNLKYTKLTDDFKNTVKKFCELIDSNQKELVEEDDQELIDNDTIDLNFVGNLSDEIVIKKREDLLGLEKALIELDLMYKGQSQLITIQNNILSESGKSINLQNTSRELQRPTEHKIIILCIVLLLVLIYLTLGKLKCIYSKFIQN